MTREELDFIGSMNMCDEISNEAYKKIVCHCEEQEPKILDTLDFAIDASNGEANYFVGFRNGLRYSKSLIDGKEPKFESCAEQEPCEDAISRQAAIDAIYKMHMNGKEGVLHDLKTEIGSDAFFAETIADAVEALEELPPVNPQYTENEIQKMQDLEQAELEKAYELGRAEQSKTGHWIYSDECHEHGRCSECGYGSVDLVGGELWNFCPNCGCKMVEPQESEVNNADSN